MTHDQISEKLKAGGWVQYSSMGNKIWCKYYPSTRRCKCNADKEGIQIVITVYELNDRISYEIELCAQKPDDMWVKLQAYGIGPELLTVMGDQINQLLAAWTVMTALPKQP